MEKLLLIFLFSCFLCIAQTQSCNNPQELISNLEQSFSSVSGYSCKMKITSFEKDKEEQNQIVWFLKPSYLKVEQLGPFKKGAIAAIQPNGKVRGYYKGFFSFFKVTLNKNDPRLISITGDHIRDTDYGSMIERLKKEMQNVVSFHCDTITENGINMIKADANLKGSFDRYRFYIDKDKWIIFKMERFKNNSLVHKIEWEDIVLNPGLDEKLFVF